MATTTPPSGPPPAAPPPREPQSPRPPRASRGRFARPLAFGALAIVVLIVLFIVLGGGGGQTYKLEFAEGDQLVRGDQVQVGGVPVGSVTNIELTHDFKALVTIHVDSSLTPLHAGTTAQVRVPSLSSVANRYVALSPGPNNNPALASGTKLPASATKDVTDLDQLFNTFNPKTRKGLQQFIQGTAEQYVGQGKALGLSTEFFAPSINATDHFFAELVRDQSTFTKFLVETAKAVTTIGARQGQLTDLIENSNTTFTAVGAQQQNLAQGLKELPVTFRQGKRTFAELPSALDALKKLVDASKPTVKPLTTLFESLKPLLTTATPVVKNFALSFNRPGPNNDLTDFATAIPGLVAQLETSTPVTVQSLQESVPITAFFGPYAPELQGTLRTFGQSGGYYDADGHYARITPVFPDFAPGGGENNLVPSSAGTALAPLKSGQLRRCPGGGTQPATDGSSPFTDAGQLSCDPSEHP
ncbi:MAG TPA: MlaD family protein [Solirubrobacteraceae bacterium]|nr:MlaD family protein [Solirubrobacteraceae bacterium]